MITSSFNRSIIHIPQVTSPNPKRLYKWILDILKTIGVSLRKQPECPCSLQDYFWLLLYKDALPFSSRVFQRINTMSQLGCQTSGKILPTEKSSELNIRYLSCYEGKPIYQADWKLLKVNDETIQIDVHLFSL